MSKIKNNGSHQYGAEPFQQPPFGTAGAEGVKIAYTKSLIRSVLFDGYDWAK